MIAITPQRHLRDDDIEVKFIQSAGPGGQNVNKVATAAQLRFNVAACGGLSAEEKSRLTRLAGKKMTLDGELVITARRFRTQERNRQDAIDRLVELVAQALEKPKPRKKTRPTLASKKRRLDSKRQTGERKKMRKAVWD